MILRKRRWDDIGTKSTKYKLITDLITTFAILLMVMVNGKQVQAEDFTTMDGVPTTSLSLTTHWNDHNDQDGKRPSSLKVQLYANGVKSGDAITITQDTKWTYTWSDLLVMDNGATITYSVKQESLVYYQVTYDTSEQNNIVITNTHHCAQTSIQGHQEWDDQNNHDGVRPSSITVQLLADGVITRSTLVSAKTNWTYQFKNLPVYQNGQKIVYSITENAVLGYAPSIDGYNIVNTRIPKKTSMTVTIKWDDANNEDCLRPEAIKVQLYANGIKYGAVIQLSAHAHWSYTYTSLPVMKKGKKISYTVKEIGVPKGYTVQVEQDFIIVNTHKVIVKTPTKVKTDDSKNLKKYLLAIPLGFILLLSIYWKYRKKEGFNYGRKYP